MYSLEITQTLDRILRKLARKNPKQIEIIDKNLTEIRENPQHRYRPLRSPLQHFNHVHIDSDFVLIFRVDHDRKTVVAYYYDHHDYVFGWKPGKE